MSRLAEAIRRHLLSKLTLRLLAPYFDYVVRGVSGRGLAQGISSLPAMPWQAGLTPTMLENRRPVWEALSSMYLDTDVSLSRDWRIRQLVASGNSTTELENILINEVHPVCKYNLVCIAGEWAGFDPEWLETKILKNLNSSLHDLLKPFRLTRYTFLRWTEWLETKKGIENLRNEHSATFHG